MEKRRGFDEDKARSVILEEAPRFGIATECYQAFSDYVLNQQRDAWIRGKEFGWNKAWHWRMKKEQQQIA
ncbi:MAG: hypothetical protein AAB570_02470 [Patescibacteria group bacterium]